MCLGCEVMVDPSSCLKNYIQVYRLPARLTRITFQVLNSVCRVSMYVAPADV